METDLVVIHGSEIKSIGDGKYGGYVVVYGSPEQPDLSPKRDYFTKDTDFGLDVTNKGAILWNHGLDPIMKGAVIGISDLRQDAKGVWAEGQLKARESYAAKVKEIIGKDIPALIEAKALGWSTATAPHRIDREAAANGTHWIKSWPLGLDVSLTPTPAEPRTLATSVKSVLLDNLKGANLGPGVERSMVMASMERANSALMNRMYEITADRESTEEDRLDKLAGALEEHKTLMLKAHGALSAYTDPNLPDNMQHLKALQDAYRSTLDGMFAGMRLGDHVVTVHGAVKTLVNRLSSVARIRAEYGAGISAARRSEIKALHADLGALVAAPEPRAAADDVKALEVELVASQARLLEVMRHANVT